MRLLEKIHLTSSSLKDFLTCPKKFYNNQIMGLQPTGISWKLEIGNAYHLGMDILHKYNIDEAKRVVGLFFQDWFNRKADDPNFNADLLEQREAMVVAMIENSPWSVKDLKAAEEQFTVSLASLGIAAPTNPRSPLYWISGKVDGIGKLVCGRKVVRDYKTKGEISKASMPGVMDRDLQASLYYYVYQRALGHVDLDGVQFCFVRRPTIQRRRKKKPETNQAFCRRMAADYAERPDFYYASCVTQREANDPSFLMNLERIVLDIDRCLRTGTWYENYTQCKGWGAGCVYLPFCAGECGWEDLYVNYGPDYHPELDFSEIRQEKETEKDGTNKD